MNATTASTMSQLSSVSAWRDMLRLRPVWNRLIVGDDNRVLLGRDWFVQTWKAFPENRKFEILIYRNQNQAQGILPLRRSVRHGIRCLTSLDEYQSPRMDLIAAPEAIEPMLRLAAGQLQRRWGWDVLDLARLRASTAEKILRIWTETGLSIRTRGAIRQRYLPLDRPWSEIVANFKHAMVKNLRRREVHLRESGPVEVRLHRESRGLGPLLDRCFQVEASGWKGREGTAIQCQRPLRRFYRQLAFRLVRQNRLRVYSLWRGDEMLSFQYCVTDGLHLASLKIGYLEPFQKYSPGRILQWHVLRLAWAEGLKRFDFVGQDQPHQAEWTPFTETLVNLRAYNRTLRGQAMEQRSNLWRWGQSRHDREHVPGSAIQTDQT